MPKILISIFLITLFVFLQSCQNHNKSINESEQKSIIDSARITVQKVFDASNNLQFIDGLKHYSNDADAYYTSNGIISSLAELEAAYRQIGPSVEVLENSIDSWNSTLLSKNTVAFTLPIHLKIKLKDVPEYTGQLIWSAIVQKRNKKWVIVQSHESWLNCVEAVAALTSPENKK